MKFLHNVYACLAICLSLFFLNLQAVPPHAFFAPYERYLKSELWESSQFKVALFIEDGYTKKARSAAEDKVGVFQMYSPTQSSIAMLAGSPQGSAINTFANSFIQGSSSATDDGYRGRLLVKGVREQAEITVSARYKLPFSLLGGFGDIGIYAPIKRCAVSDVAWIDQTQSAVSADFAIRDALTSKLESVALNLGGLRIQNWEEIGFGDCTFLLKWHRDFLQKKRNFKGVRISAHIGLTTPTGGKKDENEAFSIPLGNDGAWGFPLGAALDIDFTQHFRAGLDVNVMTLLDVSGTYRMKTDINQTEYLLLNKGKATKTFGPQWHFTFHAQGHNFFKGFSCSAAYQFIKHEKDTLYPQTDGFIHRVVNSDQSLHEWNAHSLVFQGGWDAEQAFKNWYVKPLVSLFYKYPITGKRAISTPTFGGQVSLAF